MAAFEEADLVSVKGAGGPLVRAQLALVVAGDPPVDAPDGQADVVAELAEGLDRAAAGTVVVGTTASAEDGAVAGVRRPPLPPGVDRRRAETTTGRLVGVLALAEQADGGTGQYGPDAADGACPI